VAKIVGAEALALNVHTLQDELAPGDHGFRHDEQDAEWRIHGNGDDQVVGCLSSDIEPDILRIPSREFICHWRTRCKSDVIVVPKLRSASQQPVNNAHKKSRPEGRPVIAVNDPASGAGASP
jgi:hypothetical protein